MLQIRLFGTVSVTLGDTPAPPFRSRSGGWLLCLLCLRAGKTTDREWLAAALWPDSASEQARYNLRRNLSDLRDVLGAEADRLHAPTPRTLLLELTGDAFCDLRAFDAAIAAERWEEAITLYAGPLVTRCDDAWVIGERESRHAAFLRALRARADRAAETAAWSDAVLLLRRALREDPTHEPTVRRLMHCLAGSGDPASALLAYRDLQRRLRDERLGQPEPETVAFYDALRNPPPPEAAPLSAGGTAGANPLSPPLHPTLLHDPLTPLIGREDALRAIAAELHARRWLTLTGLGGIGKTRLALETARRWPEPARIVELAGVRDPALVVSTVKHTLGVPPEKDWAQSLAEASILVVLDNCEHLLESVADLADRMLSACPNVRLLTTSREPINGPSEAIYRVAPLSPEDARLLFEERARAVSPDYQPGADMDALCNSLEGWPLAIELAAAQIRRLPPERIREAARLLRAERRSPEPRQRSLQAALDWSWERLAPEERRAACRLSVFAGGWTVETAETVCGIVPETLASLTDKSLVEFVRCRYAFREPVRQYLREQWNDPADRAAITHSHARYFLALAETAFGRYTGAEQHIWRDRLTGERDNLRAALARQGETAARLACVLTPYWNVEGQNIEGQYWLERAAGDDSLPEPVRAAVHLHAGRLVMGRAHWASAREYFRRALAFYRAGNDDAGIADALKGIGAIDVNTGNFADAAQSLEEALSLYRRREDRPSEANCLEDLGYASRSQGKFSEADRWLSAALALYQQLENLVGVASALCQQAFVRRGLDDAAGAQALMETALAHYRELDRPQSVAFTLCSLGDIERERGCLAEARAHTEEALRRFRELGRNPSWPLYVLARIALAEGETGEAAALLRETIREAQVGGATPIASDAHNLLARLTSTDAPAPFPP